MTIKYLSFTITRLIKIHPIFLIDYLLWYKRTFSWTCFAKDFTTLYYPQTVAEVSDKLCCWRPRGWGGWGGGAPGQARPPEDGGLQQLGGEESLARPEPGLQQLGGQEGGRLELEAGPLQLLGREKEPGEWLLGIRGGGRESLLELYRVLLCCLYNCGTFSEFYLCR